MFYINLGILSKTFNLKTCAPSKASHAYKLLNTVVHACELEGKRLEMTYFPDVFTNHFTIHLIQTFYSKDPTDCLQ